jgi:hypothetical protein
MGAIDLTISGANGEVTIVWTDATGLTVGTDEDLTNVAAGDYTATITDSDGCILILEDITVSVNSIDDIELNGVYLMPNPANNALSIKLDADLLSGIDVRDTRGRLMHTGSIIKNTVLDVSSWTEGVYFLTISNDFGSSTSRLVISH